MAIIDSVNYRVNFILHNLFNLKKISNFSGVDGEFYGVFLVSYVLYD
jgi:hypothetical protein